VVEEGAPVQADKNPVNTTAIVNFTKIEFTNQPSLRKWARPGNDLAEILRYPYVLDMGSF
jgi:hypothetical protein